MAEKNRHRFSRHHIGRICENLKKLYSYKCGYCESHVEAGAVLEFDHYRPKNGIKRDKSHPGYYWLGYEWTNFIPACPRCNRAKSNCFPIDASGGKRVKEPPIHRSGRLDKAKCKADSSILKAEKPLLLHPELDEPEKHLVFLRDGEVKGISQKGKKTVDICQLNRDDLILMRRSIINSCMDEIRKLLNDFKTEKINKEILHYCMERLFINILQMARSENSYSRLAWFMFRKFELYFVRPLGPKQQKVLKKAFIRFKKVRVSQP